jgi:hypothetical protein
MLVHGKNPMFSSPVTIFCPVFDHGLATTEKATGFDLLALKNTLLQEVSWVLCTQLVLQS